MDIDESSMEPVVPLDEGPELVMSVKIMLGNDGTVFIDTEGFPQNETEETSISRFLYYLHTGQYTKNVVESLKNNMESNGQSEKVKRIFQKWYNLIENSLTINVPIVRPTEFFNGRSPR